MVLEFNTPCNPTVIFVMLQSETPGFSSAEEDMDDEQMFRLDSAIAAHLGLVKDAKLGDRRRRETLINFKIRCAPLADTRSYECIILEHAADIC